MYSTWPADQLNNTSQNKQNHLKKLRNKQSNKLTKIIAKTLKLLSLRQNSIPLNKPIQKYVQNQFLFLKLLQYYICKAWKKSFAHEDRLTRKFFLKKMKSIANFNEMLLKIVILISYESFLCL